VQPILFQIGIVDEIFKWWMGGLGASVIVLFGIFVLALYFSWVIAKKFVVQLFLFLVTWLPSVIVANAVDLSEVSNPPLIPLQGYTFILFPYTWDVLLGNFRNTILEPVCLLMIALSFIALLHAGLLFTHNLGHNVLWSVPVAYFGLLGLGLGMINFHVYLWNSYSALMFSVGLHPIIPIVLFIFIMILVVVYSVIKWNRTKIAKTVE